MAPQRRQSTTANNDIASNPSQRYLRLVTLSSLMLSDGTYTVLRRYSRGVLRETYSVNEVLLAAEIIKLSFSTYMIGRKRRRWSGGSDTCSGSGESLVGEYVTASRLSTHLFNLLLQSRKMLVLVLTYGLGNCLSYYALARVGAGTFVVIANLKTLTTAAFSSLLFGRTYSWTRWRALILLVCGVVLFVLPTLEDSKTSSESDTGIPSATDASGVAITGVVMGCLAELIVIILSGFASVYFESALKNDPLDIWERNVQLGVYSMFMYFILIATYPPSDADDRGYFFSNWTLLAVTLSFLGASGGLLVALSIKHGDSVLKTLAISGSIVFASLVDAILGGPLTGQMIISAVIVIIAIINYTFDSNPTNAVKPNDDDVDRRLIHAGVRNDVEDGWDDNEETRPMVSDRERHQQ